MTTIYLQNTAAGAASGTTITVANSDDNGAGDALDVSTSGTRIYDNTYAHSGSTSFKCEGTSGNTAILGWNRTDTKAVLRTYLRMPTTPGATCAVIQSRNAASMGEVQVRTDGKAQVTDDTGAVVHTTTNALSTTAWNRLEYYAEKGTTTSDGKTSFGLYLGDSPTPVESVFTKTNANMGTADLTSLRFGKLTGIAFTWAAWFDSVAAEFGGSTFLGPYQGLSDLQYDASNIYRVDATASVGTVTLTQTSGTTCVILEVSPGLFEILVPEHPDPLWFTLIADGDGAPVIETFCIKPDNNVTLRRLRAGGDPTVLTDWV